MPLFVFLTGYFTNCQSARFNKGIANFLLVYIIFQILHIVEDRRLPVINDIFYPAFSLWYILSCVWWKLIARLLDGFQLTNKLILILSSIILSLAVGFIPSNSLSLQRTFSFLPFFICGFLMRGLNVKSYILKVNKYLCYILILLAFTLIYIANTNLFPYLTGRYWYSMMPISSFYGLISRILWYFVAIVMSVSIMRIVPNTKFLSGEGSKTLQYYLLHTLMIPIFWVICTKFGIEKNLIVAIFISIVSTVIIYFIKDQKLVSFLVKPLK